jgi:ribosome-associated protein
MISVTRSISIHESEIHTDFVRSSGPGGQNVNKVATAVQLRFDVTSSPSLPDDVRQRLIRLAGKRMTTGGVLIIDARRYRTQEQNREDAVNRLVEVIRQAAHKPKIRRATKPTLASKQRRLESKRRHSETKRRRQSAGRSED